MSVIALNTSSLTPAQFAEETLESLGDLKGVVVVNLWTDGTMSAGWTAMSTSELCMAARALSIKVDEAMTS